MYEVEVESAEVEILLLKDRKENEEFSDVYTIHKNGFECKC